MSGFKTDAFTADESADLVKWADVVPDSVPWWEGSYVATIHHGNGVDTNSGIDASVENDGTGESDE